MKLLIVSQYFWPEEFRINDIARGLVERGHAVTVLTGCPNYPGGRPFPGYSSLGVKSEEYDGVLIKRVPLVPRGKARGVRLALNYLSYCLTASLLGPFLCRGEYDAVLIYQTSPVTVGIPGLLFKYLKQARTFLWVQDLWPDSLAATGAVRSKWILEVVRKLVRAIYRNSDHVLIQSRAFAPNITAEGIPPEKIHYFPNSVEAIFQPSIEKQTPTHLESLPEGFVVMFAGNIGEAQSFKTILSAAEMLANQQDIHWVVLGDGRARAWVETEVKVRRLSRCVHLLGRWPTETMPYYFSQADALLVTLSKQPIFALTVPAKVQSYLACARPIVAALDGEGARVIRESGGGYVSAAEDAAGLANAVRALFDLPLEDRLAMGEAGRAYCAKHFEREKLLSELERLLVQQPWDNDCSDHTCTE